MDILDYAAVTHRGVVKPVNEDSILAASPVFVVADGISGSNRGDIASSMVVQQFGALVDQPGVAPELVAETLSGAHQAVREAQRREGHDSATTACGAVGMRIGEVAYWIIFNIGDSRVYRISGTGRHLAQVSVDHSHVQELIEAGLITPEQAERHPERNVITRAVGAEDQFRPDYWLVPMVTGDRLLLCSDGLLRDTELAQVAGIACADNDPEDAVRQLLELALQAGARDNVSIIVVDVHSQPTGDDPETRREFG